MWTIATYAFRERIRKKELYIFVAIAAIIFLLYGSGNMSVSVDGKPLSDFSIMFVLVSEIMFAIACILSVIMSLKTIPLEYERGSSHLVWSRKTPQVAYHAGLALSNILVLMPALMVFYGFLAAYSVINDRVDCAIRTVLAIPVAGIAVVMISLLTSMLSIRFSAAVSGLISAIIMLVGLLHRVLELYENTLMSGAKHLLRIILAVIPDIHGVGVQARNIMFGNPVDTHLLWYVLFCTWVLTLGFFLFRREHA